MRDETKNLEVNNKRRRPRRRPFRVGTLRFHSWRGIWKFRRLDSQCSPGEYESMTRCLEDQLLKLFPYDHGDIRFGRDFYLRGDYTLDRSHVLEVDPSILSLRFLKRLQHLLKKKKNKNWRIIIPTYLTDKEVIIVYPSVIRISQSHERNLAKSVPAIANRMQRWSTGSGPDK